MVRAAAFLSLLLATAPAGAAISGAASATDGDTLRIGSERIRLHGIDAPESTQSYRCHNGIDERQPDLWSDTDPLF